MFSVIFYQKLLLLSFLPNMRIWAIYFQSTASRAVLLKLRVLHEGMTLVHNLLTLSAQSVGPGRLNCEICGVCGELHLQSSHTKPKPNELVGEVCLCDQNH